jgi:hypothetical protein
MKLILSSWSSVILLLLTMLFFPNNMQSCHNQLSNLPLSSSESLESLLCRCKDSWGTAIIDQSLEFRWFADPKYVVAPAIRGPKNRRDIKARVEGEHAPIFVFSIVNLLADFYCTLSLRAIWEAFHCTMQQCTILEVLELVQFYLFLVICWLQHGMHDGNKRKYTLHSWNHYWLCTLGLNGCM